MLNRLALRRKLRLLSYAAGQKFLLLSLFLFLEWAIFAFLATPTIKTHPLNSDPF